MTEVEQPKEQLQSVRMEKELNSLRVMFQNAEANEDVGQAIALSRIILQQEKEIAKQKLSEGRTLDKSAIVEYQAKLTTVVSEVCKQYIDEDKYGPFVDTLVARLEELEDE